jgi:hypothetical protein
MTPGASDNRRLAFVSGIAEPKQVTDGTINGKVSHLNLMMMNGSARTGASSDLGEKITVLNAFLSQLSEQAEWLREEAERLRIELARTRMGSRMPLWYLLQLQHEALPFRVVVPGEVRCVSVLTATGLVEAEIGALEATARYAASPAATVTRITEHGRVEIARIENALDPAPMSAPSTRRLRVI